MQHIKRVTLLTALESIQAGLTQKDMIEQSACFVFTNGRIHTFNDEVACSIESPIDLKGAITAKPLIDILRKMPEEDIRIVALKKQLVIKGKRREVEIHMERDVRLPIDKVEEPEKWSKMDESFSEAVHMTHQCCGRDEKEFQTTCIHVTPKWIESHDNFQALRYRLKTGIDEPCLIRGASIRHITSLNMTRMALTETWIHFKNAQKLIFSVRREVAEMDQDMGDVFKRGGEPLTLPKGLGDASARAETFSAENIDDNEVIVRIAPGMIRVRSEGVSGRYKEEKKLKYKGRKQSFRILPTLLADLVKKYSECEISKNTLRVKGENFTYVVSLGKPKDIE